MAQKPDWASSPLTEDKLRRACATSNYGLPSKKNNNLQSWKSKKRVGKVYQLPWQNGSKSLSSSHLHKQYADCTTWANTVPQLTFPRVSQPYNPQLEQCKGQWCIQNNTKQCQQFTKTTTVNVDKEIWEHLNFNRVGLPQKGVFLWTTKLGFYWKSARDTDMMHAR